MVDCKQVRGKNFVYLETDEYWLQKCDFFSKGQVIQSWFDNQKYENGKIGKFP